MRLFFLTIVWTALAGPAWTGEVDGLHAPSGFTIEKAAGDPQIVFPMFAAFDDRGRLYVAESSGLDLYEELQAQTRRCRVLRLEDHDGDGRFETSQVFADKLVFPMGVCWRDGKLYVADPPDLVAYEDHDGDGRADERRVILTGFGHRDNGSLHGLTFGPDGLLYMTMGQPDGYSLRRKDGTLLSGRSGALIRCRPDGSDPEVVCRGFENLVEVVFTPEGEIIGTDNWFQAPVGGLRDALVDLAPGGLYPRVLEDEGTPQPVTGPPLPAISLFPAVALSGLTRYEGGSLGAEFRGQLFSAQHNARRVQRHELRRSGSTFVSREFDFVTSDDPDFHPSDVLQDADGDLLVIDTGGWYVQHCPTGRIRNSRALGGIYRVRRTAPKAPGDAKKRGDEVLEIQQQALWAMARRQDPASLAPLREALDSRDDRIVATATRALAVRRDADCAPKLCELLSAKQPHVRRAAAEALANCGRSAATPALFEALARRNDPFLEHALIHAVYRIASKDQLRSALEHPHPAVQRCALVLLDQHPHRGVASEAVVARLGAADERLQQAALWVLARRPDWGAEARAVLRAWLDAPALADEQRAAAANLILAFQAQKDVQQLIGARLGDGGAPPERRLLLLHTLEQCSLAALPASWIDGIAKAARDPDPEIRHAAVVAAAILQIPELDPVLIEVAERADAAAALRLEALSAVVGRKSSLSDPSFRFLVERLNNRETPLSRLAAAEILGRAKLTDAQRAALLEHAPDDPLCWPQLLPAFRGSTSREVGFALIARLHELLDQQWLRPSEADVLKVLESYPRDVRAEADELLAILRRSREELADRLGEYDSLARGGDADRGEAVFFGNEAACSACHRVNGRGGAVGPDLTRIGAVRSARDLIESIVAPSSTFAQGYENYLVITRGGRVFTGLVEHQSSETLVLKAASGQTMRLQKAEIEEMARHAVSLMPDGLEQKLSRRQFRDLLAYLQGLR